MLRKFSAYLCILLTAFSSIIFSPLVAAQDFLAPIVEHQGVLDSIEVGSEHVVTAKVTDDDEVALVVLFYRQKGDTVYQEKIMTNSLDGSGHYETTIPSEYVTEPGLEYYIQATDAAGNTLEMYGIGGKPFELAVTAQNIEIVNNYNFGSDGDLDGAFDPSNAGKSKKKKNKSLLWVGLTVLAVGLIAGAAGGGGDGGDGGNDLGKTGGGSDVGDLTVTTPVP